MQTILAIRPQTLVDWHQTQLLRPVKLCHQSVMSHVGQMLNVKKVTLIITVMTPPTLVDLRQTQPLQLVQNLQQHLHQLQLLAVMTPVSPMQIVRIVTTSVQQLRMEL